MAVDNVLLFQAIYARAKRELAPKMRLGPKSAFWIHSCINSILNMVYPGNRQDSYFHNYNTTLGFTIAMATRHGKDPNQFGNWRTLCHEIVHIVQSMRWTRVIMGFVYLWPISQGIALLLLGWLPLIWVPGLWKFLYLAGWLGVCGVHFIPQLPDPGRKRWEFEAYSVSMHLYHLVHGRIDQNYIDNLVRNFHSMMYFIMEPDEKKIRKELATLATRIEAGRSPVRNMPIVRIAVEEYARLSA